MVKYFIFKYKINLLFKDKNNKYIMSNMLEKTFKNEDLGIKMNSYIDKQQNVWFKGKDVAEILGYSNTKKAVLTHVDSEDKQLICWGPQNGFGNNSDLRGKYFTFINESGFYSLILSSKLETAKKFKKWITSEVLPSIRKYGYYKLVESPNNKMFKIENEMDLHTKVVELIRNFYPDALLVPGLGENQDTSEKRINSWKKGYQRGQPDLMVLNNHRDFKGLCIEFKSPTNNYCVTELQLKMKEKYKNNGFAFILSHDYDKISKLIHKYFAGVCIPCEYCTKAFRNKKTLNTHYKVFHRIEKNI